LPAFISAACVQCLPACLYSPFTCLSAFTLYLTACIHILPDRLHSPVA